MVLIPGGTNTGTNLLAKGESYSHSYPENYRATVDTFYMDATPVTKAQWDEVYAWAITNEYAINAVGTGKEPDHPVCDVHWHDIVKWCNARSEKEGRPPVYLVAGLVYRTGDSTNVVHSSVPGYRLPTETECEYAARGGLQGARFPWGNEISHSQANYSSRGDVSYDTSPTRGYHPQAKRYPTKPLTSPVRAFNPNGYGLYDMAGNVFEYCYKQPPQIISHVYRGGSWGTGASSCRVGFCEPMILDWGNLFGFRTVLSTNGLLGSMVSSGLNI
jgi:formylglycine-generating enzyme required for sulfatase activity